MLATKRKWLLVGLLGVLSLWGCSAGVSPIPSTPPTEDEQPAPSETPVAPTAQVELSPTSSPVPPTDEVSLDPTDTPSAKPASPDIQADVLSVSVNGEPGAYNFSVTVGSPDEGCSQYADWWEVISQDGALLYRRILLHSHVNEQPFTRSGGPVPIDAEEIVLVRAHMHPAGYGGILVQGTVAGGFEPVELGADFASDLAEAPPLPQGCNF
jgi:hypothetical protein